MRAPAWVVAWARWAALQAGFALSGLGYGLAEGGRRLQRRALLEPLREGRRSRRP